MMADQAGSEARGVVAGCVALMAQAPAGMAASARTLCGAPTRKRRSERETKPPKAMMSAPVQIHMAKRMVRDADDEGAGAIVFAGGDVEVGEDAGADAGFGRHGVAFGIVAALGDELAV